ncbi:MAG: outer membrane protein assembly factor BamA precursor [Planctomycetota bacterium]
MLKSPEKRPRQPRAAGVCACWLLLAIVAVGPTTATAAVQSVQDASITSPAEEDAESGGGRVIVDVRVEGNETIPESVILQKIQSQPHRTVTEKLLREDKRSLLNTRWFFEVRERIDETPDGLVLVFVVKERPIVQRVVFRGNKKIKLKHLEAWTGLKAGSPFDYVANQEAVRRIEQEYRDKGYFFVKVTLTKGSKPGDREVVFDIQEGPKVQVKERNFQGNQFWSDAMLRKNLISKEAFLLWGGHYNPDTIPSDVESLKAYYRSVGYFDVEVTAEPRFSDDRSDVELLYTITEGRRYQVRSILYEGNSIIPTARLSEDSKLQPGDKFSSLPLNKDVQRMLGYYGELGHFFASVNPVPRFTEQEGIVDLVFEIDEDRPRYIREINVHFEGDYPHTKHTVVLDRIQVQPGDLADPKRIRRGQSRLKGSGLFDPNIQFETTPVDPEQTSIASLSGIVRGQGPAGGESDWTARFVQAVDQESQRAVRVSEIGNYDDLFGGILTGAAAGTPSQETPAESQSEAGHPATSGPGVGSAKPAEAEVRAEAVRQSAVRPAAAIFTARSEPQNFAAQHTSGVGEDVWGLGAAEPSEMLAGGDMLRSEALPQTLRTLNPADLFATTEEPPLLMAAGGPQADDEYVIRGQNPGPGDIAAPTREDQLINESPYRNQFRDIPPGWVDLNVNASEGQTGRLMFGAGVNSNAGVVGNFVWDESNFDLLRPPTSWADVLEGRAWRGGGQRFRLEAAPGNQVSRYALTWTDPYFMYSDYSLSVSGFYFNRYYQDWTEDRLGGRVGIGRQLTPEWSTAVALRLEDVEMRQVRQPTPAIVQPLVGHSFLSTGRISLTHDTRDNPMLPGEGHFFDVGYEQAFNDFTFPKVDTEFRQYFTLHSRPDGSGRQVLTLAGALGWAGDDTPVFERYYAGGYSSFRGFRFRGVTPRDPTGFSLGGIFQTLGTVEYRLPLTADDMISMVVFSDFGTVDDEVQLSEFRATAGFGARIAIPMMGPVPLAFDFAFPITSEPGDREQVFSFYVGINR